MGTMWRCRLPCSNVAGPLNWGLPLHPSPVASRSLQLLLHNMKVEVDVTFWLQHISFLLVGLIIMTSIRGFLVTLQKVWMGLGPGSWAVGQGRRGRAYVRTHVAVPNGQLPLCCQTCRLSVVGCRFCRLSVVGSAPSTAFAPFRVSDLWLNDPNRSPPPSAPSRSMTCGSTTSPTAPSSCSSPSLWGCTSPRWSLGWGRWRGGCGARR